MKVIQALRMQNVIDNKAIPSDMLDEHLVYYSESRQDFIKVVDMDVAHLVRAFNKIYQEKYFDDLDQKITSSGYQNAVDYIEKDLDKKIGFIQKYLRKSKL